jgi:hypothetical protein
MNELFTSSLQVDGVEETGHHLPMHEHKKHRGESYILKSS